MTQPADNQTTPVGFPDNAYERFNMAFGNIAKGNLSATTRALFSPDSLSPNERNVLRFFKDQKGIPATMLQTAWNMATNPLTIIGLLVSIRFPIANARELFKVMKNSIGTSKKIDPVTAFVSTPHTIFADKPIIAEAMASQTAANLEYSLTTNARFAAASEKFRTLTGRYLTKAEGAYVSFYLDGGTAYKAHLGRLADYMTRIHVWNKPSKLLKNRGPLKPLQEAFPDTQVRNAIKEVIDADRATFNDSRAMLQGLTESQQKIVMEAAHRKGMDHDLGPDVENYFPHNFTNYRDTHDRIGLTTEEMTNVLVNSTNKKLSDTMLSRKNTIKMPDLDSIELLKDYLDPEFYEAVKRLPQRSIEWTQKDLIDKIISIEASGGDKITRQNAMTKHLKDTYSLSDNRSKEMARDIVNLAELQDKNRLKLYVTEQKNILGHVYQYDIDRGSAASKYIAKNAPHIAWNKEFREGRSHAEILVNAMETYKQEGDIARYQYLAEDYIPMLQGLKPWKHGVSATSMYMKDLRIKMRTILEDPEYLARYSKIPGFEKGAKFLAKQLKEGTEDLHDPGLSSFLTEQIHLGALGGNIGTAVRNLPQSVFAPAAVVGVRSTLAGHRSVLSKLPALASEWKKAYGETHNLDAAMEQALGVVFPEFKVRHHEQYSKLRDMSVDTSSKFRSSAKSAFEKGKDVSMIPFTASELYNRLATWETGLHKALKDGLSQKEAYDFASKLIHFTQYPGGVTGTPHGLLRLNPVLRQFSQFGFRTVDLLWSSMGFPAGGKTPYLKSLERFTGARLNPGTLGRLAMLSGAGYELAKGALGLDISSSIPWSGVPQPAFEGSPFYPSPFVPPILGMAGKTAMLLNDGEFRQIPGALAPLVPAGVAMNRLYKTVSPTYTKWSRRGPDGKVPVMDKNGRLVASYTPAQLLAKAMGVNLISTEQESEMVNYLIKQRDILSTYRRDYTQAVVTNDLDKANKIKADYQKRYPQLPPLQMKKTDIKNYQRRNEMSRIQRTLNSLPKDARDMFSAAIAITYGTNPNLMTAGGLNVSRLPSQGLPASEVFGPVPQPFGPLGSSLVP